MKKNLISIVILALLIVNIVLTSIMLFSVIGTNKKTAALVTDIASAISLDLGTDKEEEVAKEIPMKNVETYDISEMTIPLKMEEDGDGKEHFAVFSFTLSMDTKNKGYKAFGADIATKESLIKGEINDVVGAYTLEEARNNTQAIEDEILQHIQKMYDSDFIFKVTISGRIFQ